MTWLAWRQQRFPLTAVAVWTLLIASLAAAAHADRELALITQLASGYLTVGVCMFWGVPLVARDLEQRTHRLAWTQSGTRDRWLGARLTVAAAGSLAAAGLTTALIALGLPTEAELDPMTWYYYESHGVVPFARVLFALAFGTVLGALIGQAQIAMAVSVPFLGLLQLGGARALREQTTLDYWSLQLTEGALYLLGALVCAALAWLAIRQRS